MKAAVIGFGGMGRWHVSALTQRIPEINVTGVYDIRPEAQEAARAKGLHVYQSQEALFDDSTIDTVIIATPNDSHKAYIIAGLEAGKHVISEKPVVLTSQDLLDIMAVEEQAKGLFTIHQNRRWDKDFQIVKEILAQDLVGKPYFMESRVNGSSVFLHGWRDYKVNGGGMLYDWGVHLIDQMLQLIPQKVISVNAQLYSIHSQEVDDNVKVYLTFEDGFTVMVEVATNCFIPSPRWHVSCKNGTFVIEDWACNGKIVQLADSEALKWENDIVYTAAGPTRTMAPRPEGTTIEIALPSLENETGDAFHQFSSADHFYQNFLAAVKGEGQLAVSSTQALRVIQLLELAFESSDRRQSIACLI